MEHKKQPTLAEEILSALLYLYRNSPSSEIKGIIKLSMDLCYSTSKAGFDDDVASDVRPNIKFDGIIASLEYLKDEAERKNLRELGMILDATFKLCLATHYLQLRNCYRPADVLMAANG